MCMAINFASAFWTGFGANPKYHPGLVRDSISRALWKGASPNSVTRLPLVIFTQLEASYINDFD